MEDTVGHCCDHAARTAFLERELLETRAKLALARENSLVCGTVVPSKVSPAGLLLWGAAAIVAVVAVVFVFQGGRKPESRKEAVISAHLGADRALTAGDAPEPPVLGPRVFETATDAPPAVFQDDPVVPVPQTRARQSRPTIAKSQPEPALGAEFPPIEVRSASKPQSESILQTTPLVKTQTELVTSPRELSNNMPLTIGQSDGTKRLQARRTKPRTPRRRNAWWDDGL